MGDVKSCVCSVIYLSPYLGDDLSILGVDLSDAPALGQEGEDLIELEEENGGVTAAFLSLISCPAVNTKIQTLLMNPGGRPQATL